MISTTSLESTTIEIRNAIAHEGMLLGGRPTAEEFAEISAEEFRTVIDLRTLGEEGVEQDHVLVEKLGMKSISIEVAGSSGLTLKAVTALDLALARSEGPAVLHCASGNRVGAILALRAFWIQGKSAEEAQAIGLETGLTSLEDSVREILKSATMPTPTRAQSQGADAQQ